MFRSLDSRKMTLGELITLCYEELAPLNLNDEELSLAVASRLSELLSGHYEAEIL